MKELITKYDINDFYYAEMVQIPASHKKFCAEVNLNLLFHPNDNEKKIYRTILLKIGEGYMDIEDPRRKVDLERDAEKECTLIRWKHSLGEYPLPITESSLTLFKAWHLLRKYRLFFEEQSEFLEAAHPSSEISEVATDEEVQPEEVFSRQMKMIKR